MEQKTLIEVRDLTVGFPSEKDGIHTVVDHINFDIHEGEIVGIVGESGSGKSMTALSIMGLLNKDAVIMDGSVKLRGTDILKLNHEERRKIQGDDLSMVFQEPMTSLNPVMRIGDQVGEVLKLHTKLSDEEIDLKVAEALTSVGLKKPEELMKSFPHQLSGGMRQRVMIAMAIINQPDLIICDEPTTALDVTVQAQILALLRKIQREKGCSILFISHDLNVIKEICQKVIVMYHGTIVEQGTVEKVMYHPEHDYTRKLVASMPEQLTEDIPKDPLIHVKDLNIYYRTAGKIFTSKKDRMVYVKDLSFDIYKGEIFGLVGESGCGKTTVAKALTGLNTDIEGTMDLGGTMPQMVFQDPFSSLNPAMKIGKILEEPLKLAGVTDKAERRKKVNEMLLDIGLDESFAKRYARELSGGQRQRIAIGLALMRGEKFIIADEPVSALDVTVQSQILKLLIKLHKEKGLTILLISHDLNIVRHMCSRVVVMYLGRIVEMADVNELYENPMHPYTRMLFESVLTDKKKTDTDKITVNEVRPLKRDQEMCAFYGRCRYAQDKCQEKALELRNIGTEENPHLLRCCLRIGKAE